MPFVRGPRADQQRDVHAVEGVVRVVVQIEPAQQRKGAVDQLHRDALERAHRRRDLQQPQIDRLIGAEQLPGGDAKDEAVADLPGCAGDCDSYWFLLTDSSPGSRLSSIEARNSCVVCHCWSGPTSRARSLVIFPLSTVCMHTRSSVSRELTHRRRAVHPPAGRQAARPREDRGDRVGRGRLALLMLAVMAGDSAVRGLGLDRLAVGAHQHAASSGQASRSPARRCRIARHRRSSCRPTHSRPPTSGRRRPCRRSSDVHRLCRRPRSRP